MPLPADYVIGPDDVLSIVFWRDKDMSAEVVVRPDGKISLPLLNDMQAAGLTPEQLRERHREGGDQVHRRPERHGRRQGDQQPQGVITGKVAKPGPYPLSAPTDGAAADRDGRRSAGVRRRKNILIMRTENGQEIVTSSSTTRT